MSSTKEGLWVLRADHSRARAQYNE